MHRTQVCLFASGGSLCSVSPSLPLFEVLTSAPFSCVIVIIFTSITKLVVFRFRCAIYLTNTSSSFIFRQTMFIDFSRNCGALPSLPRLPWSTFKNLSIMPTHFLHCASRERNTFSDYHAGWLEVLGDLTRYRIIIAAVVSGVTWFVFSEYCCRE